MHISKPWIIAIFKVLSHHTGLSPANTFATFNKFHDKPSRELCQIKDMKFKGLQYNILVTQMLIHHLAAKCEA